MHALCIKNRKNIFQNMDWKIPKYAKIGGKNSKKKMLLENVFIKKVGVEIHFFTKQNSLFI
jgi:hypothetical protein